MKEKRFDVYCVSCGSEQLVAENMTVEDACVLVKAMFAGYYAQQDLVMQIRHRKEE